MSRQVTTSNHKPTFHSEIDTDALAEKYRAERGKRIRGEGIDQYRTIDELAIHHYITDVWTELGFTREPVAKTTDVLVIGGGFGGQLIAARLQGVGITNILIIDKAADFGGAWYWNRYPGLSCDIESYIYLPLLEEMDYMPTEKYAKGAEILAYAQEIGQKFDLYSKALFQAEVTALEWDDSESRWTGSTNWGDKIYAKFVAIAGGPMHSPKLPGIPGIERFKGHGFHTSRWDYSYTGGNDQGSLNKLRDKRVGVIGTGSSAIQVIPHLALSSRKLYVFQRTPSSVNVRLDQPTDPGWATKMKSTPGWQRRRMENFNTIVTGGMEKENLVGDGWTDICHNLSIYGGREKPTSLKQMAAERQTADYIKMSQIRARVDEIVEDPETAQKLKPWYNQFCKRPCFHNEYLSTFNRHNVMLIDTTEGTGIESIDETGVNVKGQHFDLDCIIYATGFESSNDYSQRMGMAIRGKNGLTLSEKWKGGMSTLHGLHTRGFPNSFIISSSQSGFTPNFMHALEELSRHVAYIVSEALQKRKIRAIEPSQEAEEAWTKTVVDLAHLQTDFVIACTPGYYNMEGVLGSQWLRSAPYGLGSPAFFKLMDNWRKDGQLKGLEAVYE